ncbi:MAG: hypothetical protein ACYCPS_02400 [Candidatus Saccharimonadales bacterium]
MKIRIIKKKIFWQAIILLVIDSLFFGLTDPNTVNSVFLLISFVLFGASLYVLIQIILVYLIKLGFKFKNRKKIAVFAAVLVSLLLALQSVGQLTGRDVLIFIPLTVLLFIYIAYIRPKTLV